MNLFNDLRKDYGQSTVKTVRDYENIERKIARHRNHLVYTLRCKDENVIPPSLKIKSPINTSWVRDIVNKAQKALVRERIRVINNKLDNLKQTSTEIRSRIQQQLPDSVYSNVATHIAKSRESEFQKAKWRQLDKLQRLMNKNEEKSSGKGGRHQSCKSQEPDLGGQQLKRWVVNLSKYKLNKAQNDVLEKGLNFAPTPTTIPVDEMIIATEKACWKIPEEERNTLRAKIVGALKSAKMPKSNLNKDQRQALKDLTKEKSILVLPADKGRCTIVMDTDDYETKVKTMLDDERTYEKLEKDPTPKYKRKLVGMLQNLKKEDKITDKQYKELFPTAENIPRIYATPKIHKPQVPLRPIVDYTGSIGYSTSRALADILGPLVGNTIHHVKNSKDLAQEMSEVLIEEDAIFNSHDVVSLFTNVPIQQAIDVVRQRLN